mmetsp:Transcript_104777/g.146044  ORF Transcript_104777/g.146044 Transcript_104777/m.146044 type:complete len:327 (+) Transcript_104777:73-1053(+)|eukprot:s978_g2.t1
MNLQKSILLGAVAVAASHCPDAGCAAPEAAVEEVEAIESEHLQTELLQVKLELVPRVEALESGAQESGHAETSVYYGKLMTSSPHWCGYIPWLVQFLVPPCWFGKPEHRNETLGPDGLPVWCQDVYAGARAYVKDCAKTEGGAPAAPTMTAAQKGSPPDWCKYIPENQKQHSPDCAPSLLNEEWTAERQANFAFRPAASLTAVDTEGSATSDTYYGKVLSTSPHWCGYVPWVVQFVVPPCWFGKPSNSTVGADGKPDWCKWVPNLSKGYVPECAGGTVDSVTGSGVAVPVDANGAPLPATGNSPGQPDWCKWVPFSSKGYVPDCSK